MSLLAALALHGVLTAGFDLASAAPALTYTLTDDRAPGWSLAVGYEQPLTGQRGAVSVVIGFDLLRWP